MVSHRDSVGLVPFLDIRIKSGGFNEAVYERNVVAPFKLVEEPWAA